MELVKPGIGLVFWMTVSFLIVLFILKKYAWGPILSSLKERETSIEDSIQQAEKARQEMEALKADNEQIIREAKAERDLLLREARDTKDKIIAESKDKATEEANKIIASARDSINNEKMAAITELKNQVANLSIEIAEKVLKQELENKEKQQQVVNAYLNEVKLN